MNPFHTKMLHYAAVKAFNHNSNGKHNVYAVAIDNRRRIIAEAGNSYDKSHPLQAHYASKVNQSKKIYPHAEILLLAMLYKLNKKAKAIFIARVDKNGNDMLAKPCSICYPALLTSGIDEIYWTENS